MDRRRLVGTGVAVATPFKSDGSLDDKAFERLLNSLIYAGVEYIVALGTTGETPTLTKEEKKQIVALAIETIDGRVPLIMGIGGNNTAEIVETIKGTNFE